MRRHATERAALATFLHIEASTSPASEELLDPVTVMLAEDEEDEDAE